MFEVFFDVETKKFFDDTGTSDPADLGVSIASVYSREIGPDGKEVSGQMQSFWEADFDSMWNIFQQAHRIIGFNSVKFDVPALKPYAPATFSKLPHFDILDKVREIYGRRVSLNRLASGSLGNTKTDHGSNAILYWQQNTQESLAKLKSYCEADVAITRDLYDYIMVNKQVKFIDHWNTPRVIELDFSYSQDSTPAPIQAGLF